LVVSFKLSLTDFLGVEFAKGLLSLVCAHCWSPRVYTHTRAKYKGTEIAPLFTLDLTI
jgi:hypothetical protein